VLEKYEHLKIGSVQGGQVPDMDDDAPIFGEGIPFGDPNWYQVYFETYENRHSTLRIMVSHIVNCDVL
jgi:hypothetical protein